LVFKIAIIDQFGFLDDSIRQSGLAVINMRDYTEISGVFTMCHLVYYSGNMGKVQLPLTKLSLWTKFIVGVIMKQFNIHAAKTNLSALVEKAAVGDSFIIAKAGKPMVKVIPFTQNTDVNRRIGFLKNQIKVAADFDKMGQTEIIELFEARS